MKKLFFYVVKVNLNGVWTIKFGQTSQYSKREDAIQYAVNETYGKLKAVVNSDAVIYCEAVTEIADKNIADGSWKTGSAPIYEKYDDFVREQLKKSDLHTGYHKVNLRNDVGGGSRELHTYEGQDLTSEQIDDQWIRLMNEGMHGSKNKADFAPR